MQKLDITIPAKSPNKDKGKRFGRCLKNIRFGTQRLPFIASTLAFRKLVPSGRNQDQDQDQNQDHGEWFAFCSVSSPCWSDRLYFYLTIHASICSTFHGVFYIMQRLDVSLISWCIVCMLCDHCKAGRLFCDITWFILHEYENDYMSMTG